MKTNPRFVWLVGAITEQFPDVPNFESEHRQGGDLVLWDRQEKKPAAMVSYEYAQAMCLELTDSPASMPFTNLENWFNDVDNESLESENLTPTKTEYQSDEMPQLRTQD